MARYFSALPTINYDLTDSGEYVRVKNITVHAGFDTDFKNNAGVYSNYLISDGETPEIIAHNEYGSSDRHWIILSFNDIIDPQLQWPLNYRVLHSLIDLKYSSTEYANTAGTGVSGSNWAKNHVKDYYKIITHTELVTGEVTRTKLVVDSSVYANITPSSTILTLKDGTSLKREVDKSLLYYYDYETELNESKRLIKLPKIEFVESIMTEYEKVMNV